MSPSPYSARSSISSEKDNPQVWLETQAFVILARSSQVLFNVILVDSRHTLFDASGLGSLTTRLQRYLNKRPTWSLQGPLPR